MLKLEADNLSGIAHGFYGSAGGHALLVPGAPLVTVKQIHSPDVVTVTAPWETGAGPQADAMVTATANIALGIITADCAPVLFADADAGVIGAAHAGWKGAISGVTDATIAAMEKLGAKPARIRAAIGPCISQRNYEVGPEFEANFTAADSANARFFAPSEKPGHFRFDLEGYVGARLSRAGIENVVRLGTCTYAAPDQFFSFRRSTHRKESDYGRQVSVIALRA